jgi:hypothetical protein
MVAVRQDAFKQHCSAPAIHVDVPFDLIHRLAYANRRRFVKYGVHSLKRGVARSLVADVAAHHLGFPIQIFGPFAAWMNLFVETVEYPHIMTSREQTIDDMRTNESGSSGDQYSHLILLDPVYVSISAANSRTISCAVRSL